MQSISSLIQKGEGFSIEFKQRISSPKKIAKEITAFSNTKGGYLFIGIDDRGHLTGVDSIEKEKEALKTAAQSLCFPPIDLRIDTIHLDNKSILSVRIGEGKQKPYRCLTKEGEERIYIRVRDKNLIASSDVIKSMRNEHALKKKRRELDKNGKKLIAYLKKNERITLSEFKEFTNISRRRASRILTQLIKTGVIRNHTFEKENFYTLSFE